MKTITGRSFKVSVHTKESVTSLKSRICREQFPGLEHVIRLYHCKRIMHGHCSVLEYNVREGDLIHLALPLYANGSTNGDDGLDKDDLTSGSELSKRQEQHDKQRAEEEANKKAKEKAKEKAKQKKRRQRAMRSAARKQEDNKKKKLKMQQKRKERSEEEKQGDNENLKKRMQRLRDDRSEEK